MLTFDVRGFQVPLESVDDYVAVALTHLSTPQSRFNLVVRLAASRLLDPTEGEDVYTSFTRPPGFVASDLGGRSIVQYSTRYTLYVPDLHAADFDWDGELDVDDIDLLCDATSDSNPEDRFDLDGSGVVDLTDLTNWVEVQKRTFFGDTNLDGTVNFSDFLALSAGFGETGNWSNGDFDCSGNVAFPDFLALSENFGNVSTNLHSVPKPETLCPFVLGLVAMGVKASRVGVHNLGLRADFLRESGHINLLQLKR